MLRATPTRVAALFVFVLILAPIHLLAQAAVHREHKRLEREQIEALEREWQQAALTEDVAAMDKLLSEDYLGINASGEVVTKNQQLDHMRDRQFVIRKLQTSELKIKLIGNIAIVTSLAQVEGISDANLLHGDYRYTRVYQRLPGNIWKITSFEATPARMHQALPPQSALQTPGPPIKQ